MSESRTFIFYPDWKECIDKFDKMEDKYALLKAIVDYGTTGEYQTDNSVAEAIFSSLIKPKIDIAQQNYNAKIAGGEKGGRKKKFDDSQVKSLAKEGKGAKEIAQLLGISTDAVYHSEEWKTRHL